MNRVSTQGGLFLEPEIFYDRTHRPLEFWAATLATADHPCALPEDDLEAVIRLALRYCYESAPAHIKCLAHYVLGKAILRLRAQYPKWREWVGYTAILAGEWAQVVGDDILIQRSEALYVEYIRNLDH